MAAKSNIKEPQMQNQDAVYCNEEVREGVLQGNERAVIHSASPSNQSTPNKQMHAAFQNKSPAPLMYTHSDLQRNVQQLVDDINAKRKRDADSISDIRKTLEVQASNSANIIEETLVGIYEENSKVIQEKLQEIFAALDRISNLERELSEFKEALGLLYQDLRDPV